MANRTKQNRGRQESNEYNFNINCSLDEWRRLINLGDRKIFLYGEITELDEGLYGDVDVSMTSRIIENILEINYLDKDIEPEKRTPIMLYINSPGGEIPEGFALISTIEISKTPIYTINTGQWSSLSFWIGIAGHKRYSLPYARFLMHDGSTFLISSTNKAQDCMEFNKRFGQEVIKKHVLKHSNMKAIDYDTLSRVEVYMLPEDALDRGFIDCIVTDINDIL